MGALRFTSHDNSRPFCKTDFGTYQAGFDNYPVYSDKEIGDVENGMTTVYWSKLDDQLLYRGFDVNAAFDAMERDYQMKAAGSLLRNFIQGLGKEAA